MAGWEQRAARAVARYEDGARRLPQERDERQRQLTRMGNAGWAAGLSLLMLGRRAEAADWLVRAAERYRESWPHAPPESWGRPIGAMKARLIAGDLDGALADARWALDAGAGESESPIGRYAAVLAHLVCGEDADARQLGMTLREHPAFPQPVAHALAAMSVHDATGYEAAARAVLADFESRDEFLEDVPVADTLLVLQELARTRGLATALASAHLPG